MTRYLLRTILLAALACLGFGTSWFYREVDQVTQGAPAKTLVQIATDPKQVIGRDHINILIVGKDYNHDQRGIAYSSKSRADTILLVSLDLVKHTAAAISVPRDTWVTATDGRTGKINATLVRGGIQLLKSTLEKTLDIQFDHYVIIKDTAVKNVVDAVGGVWVESIDAMRYKDSWGGLDIDLPKGRQFINGQQAVGFVRFREVNRYRLDKRGNTIWLSNVLHSKEEGDLRRTERQRQLIQAVAERALLPENISRFAEIAEVAFGQIETDFSRSQLLALAALFRTHGSSQLQSLTLPGTGGMHNGVYYIEMDKIKAKASVDWLLKGNPSAKKRLLDISVLNASCRSGVAKATANLLVEQGYIRPKVATAKACQATSGLIYKQAVHQSDTNAIRGYLGIENITKSPTYPLDGDVIVVIGKDMGSSLLQPNLLQ